MSRGYTTPQDRSRRRKATVIVVVAVVVLVGWIAAVAALAGQSSLSGDRSAGSGGGSPQGGAGDAGSDSSARNQEAASANASPETTAEEGAEDGQGEPSGGDHSEASEPDQGSHSGQAVTGEAETGDVFGPLEEQSQPQGDSTGSGEAKNAETEIARARAASEDFITAAYGYSGESEDDYLEGIEQAASEQIYDSPGGSMLKGYSQAAPECGMRSTAILEEFEVIGQSPEGLDAAVTFSVEDADGQTHTFSQDQRLTTSGDSYEVSGVSMEELISDTTPRESCPGAQSSGASSSDTSSSDASSEGVQDEIKPSGTSVADEDRAKAAAGRYISSAYGYTGESGKDYRDGINRTADTKALYSSPGGERIREYAKAAEEDGITAAAVMESYEITTSTDGGIVKGTAYFKVGREYDRYGQITGETTSFEVDLTLSPVRSTYEVSASSLEREVSEKSETRPAKKTS